MVRHLPVGDAEVETVAGGIDEHVVPFHVAVDQAVEPPLRPERVEKALEVLVLLKKRRNDWPDAAEVAERVVAAAAERQDHRRLPHEQRLELLVLDERARLGVIEANSLAEHPPELDRKALVAAVIGEKAFGLGQELEHDRVPALVVADETRHDPRDLGNAAGEVVADRLPLEREHGVGLQVAHLLDEQARRALADHLEIAVAAARVEDGDAPANDLVGADERAIHQEVGEVGGGEVHASFLWPFDLRW